MPRTAEELWENHTFRVLLEDLYKARKDEALGPMRLEAVLAYAGRSAAPGKSAPAEAPRKSELPAVTEVLEVVERPETAPTPGRRKKKVSKAPAGIAEEEDNPKRKLTPQEKMTWGDYLNARRAERRDPNADLRKWAQMVVDAVKGGKTQIRLPRTAQTQGLEAILKAEFHLPFSRLTCTLPPKQTQFSAPALSSDQLDAYDASPQSEALGAKGAQSDGWVIDVIR